MLTCIHKKPMKLIILVTFILLTSILKSNSQTLDTVMKTSNYSLHFNIIKGNGVPILFESGGGDDGQVWNNLLTLIHQEIVATLITYDRVGFGKSPLDTVGLNITTEVESLEEGLKKLGYGSNYFLVSHSLGGSYAMVFASRNKGKVTGGVFIDVNTPCFMTEENTKKIIAAYDPELSTLKKEKPGVYYLLKYYQLNNRKMLEAARTLNIPLTVIGSDIPPYKGTDSLKWKNCLREFALKRPNRKYIMAKHTGHYVFFDDPKLVTKEIISLYRSSSL